jgi:cytoskeletal protein RodZ
MSVLDKYVGSQLRSRRLELELSQATVAASIKIPIETYVLFEDGVQRIPSHILVELARFLGLPVAHFFQGRPK